MQRVSQLRIRLLGGLSVERLDEREIGSRKGRTLLKLLATRGRAVPADRIADVLWGDTQPARPADQVGVLVSRLRAVLGAERLPRSDAGYALIVDWLDVDEVETRVLEAERRHASGQSAAAKAAAEAALALVRGPLLPDEDGDWVDAEGRAADRMKRRAQIVLAEVAVATGDHGSATAAAEALLVADPYDEVAFRALMRAHAGAGRPASALAAYVEVRERLAEDLGVSPTPETEVVHDAIVLGTAAPSEGVTTAPATLAGRDRELALLRRTLTQAAGGDPVLVLVVGEAGIGKTALLDTTAGEASGRGFAVVRCVADAVGGALPLQPLLDALAAALRGVDLGADSAAMEALHGPTVARTEPTATVLADRVAGRAALFAAILSGFERVASGRPLLLSFDDVHDADAASLAWLDFARRRSTRLAIFATSRSPGVALRLSATHRIDLGPLDVAAVATLVGDDRAAELHERSGGNPLFLAELARAGKALPASIRQAVTTRVELLGRGPAEMLRTAAVLGPELDLDLLAVVAGRGVAALLDDADLAAGAGILREHDTTYAFAHGLVREALVAGLTGARRQFVHREAARALADRAHADPKAIAWHATQGGDTTLAAEALLGAAAKAAARYDHDEAERVLTEAIQLVNGAPARLARARVRLARWDVAGAVTDAAAACDLDAGAEALEVAGWAAYYGRDFDAAQRHADEGAERATDDAVRASCLALAGRSRHARGQLHEAEPRLVEAAACRVTEVRTVALVWLAGLRAHQGESDQARELAERALLEPTRFGHPFGPFHAQFYRALAAGMQGRADDVVAIALALERQSERAGAQGARHVPIAMNLRAWPLRAAGRTSEALDVLESAFALCPADEQPLAEPRRVGMLDVIDTLLDARRIDAAAAQLGLAAGEIEDWTGTMAWRAQQRIGLIRARVDLLHGDVEAARAAAVAVADDAAASGNRRHAALALCLAAEATARAGQTVDVDAIDHVVASLDRVAGLEAPLVTARMASACGVDAWWRLAERRAAAFVAGAGDLSDDAGRHLDRSFEALRRPRSRR